MVRIFLLWRLICQSRGCWQIKTLLPSLIVVTAKFMSTVHGSSYASKRLIQKITLLNQVGFVFYAGSGGRFGLSQVTLHNDEMRLLPWGCWYVTFLLGNPSAHLGWSRTGSDFRRWLSPKDNNPYPQDKKGGEV
jgi:hypothetical protein